MMRPSAYAGILKLFTPRGRDHPPSLKLRRTGRSTRLNSSQARLQCATGILPVLLITACTHTSNVQHVPGAVDTRAAARASVRRALDYLESSQIDAQEEAKSGMFGGGWPQKSKLLGLRRSENSPFYVSFIHHALCQLTPGNARALGLARGDLARARTVRAVAIAMMRRFETKPPTSFPGSYGFWPRAESVPEPAQGGVWPFVHKWFTMPAPGDLAPLHQQ